MAEFKTLTSRVVPLPIDNIDTDQIIPARFLKGTDRRGLGNHLFHDWRYDEKGRRIPESPFHNPQWRDTRILIAGHNFGCGSSREHAAWALYEFGIRVVISTSFADIFRNNAVKNGILLITVNHAFHRMLLTVSHRWVEANLDTCMVVTDSRQSCPFTIDSFDRKCLVSGRSQLDLLLSALPEIRLYEEGRS